jgi:methylmalonyl-CoA mutase C-terminal domain/subunit
MSKRPRVLIGKVGLDGHDVGARVVSRALADAGMEVIYTGLRQSPQQISLAALQESVDVIGLSILSGAHMMLVAALVKEMKQCGIEDIPLVVGGIIPKEDVAELKAAGVSEVFPPETPTQKIVEYFNKLIDAS